jgi:hypothetical protein
VAVVTLKIGRGCLWAAPLVFRQLENGNKLATVTGFGVRLCRLQLFTKHSCRPIRDRLRGLAQLSRRKLCDHSVTTAMRRVVIDDQIIGMVMNLGKVMRGFRIGSDYTRNRYRLAASTHANQNSPHIQICIFGGNKENLGIVTGRLGLIEKVRVHTDVFDRKRATIIEKGLLLVSYRRNETGERLF